MKLLKILLLIFSFSFLNSCSSQVQNQPDAQNNSIENSENKILERLPKPLEKIQLPETKVVFTSAIIRHSETKDEKGWITPPYKSAEIKFGFKNEPKIGEKATIIPLKVKLEPFQLKITKTTKRKNFKCVSDKTREFYWLAEFDTITDENILKIEPAEKGNNSQMLFSVFIIYPSVQFAKSLDISSISKTPLPNNVALKRIESAIDLDNDDKPDLLSVGFCCGNPKEESAENCPYLCSKYYKKNNGVWKIIDIHDFQEMC